MRQRQYDLDAWTRARFALVNETGGRGYEHGVRRFDCPICGEHRGRAWINVLKGTAGCFNAGCRFDTGGAAVELVRLVEGFATRTETVVFLRDAFPQIGPPPLPASPPATYDDWCRLPAGMRPVPASGGAFFRRVAVSRLLDEAVAFARRQWGVTVPGLSRWGVGYCTEGRYVWRLIFPVQLGGQVVAFQARSYRGGEPKYLTSRHGTQGDPEAECGRPAGALLFNLDTVTEGSDVVLVEGPGDVAAWVGGRVRSGELGRTVGNAVPVAVLGVALTEEKIALLAAKKPRQVICAADADAPRRSEEWAEMLAAWGLLTAIGRWVGGKDAGSGARLEVGATGDALAILRRRVR